MFCAVYLQHHKDQLEVFIWVKNRFKKFLCQKINILAFFTKNVPLNSQAFLGIRICDKNNLSTRAHHLNNTKIWRNQFWTRKNGKGKWCKIFGVQYIISFIQGWVWDDFVNQRRLTSLMFAWEVLLFLFEKNVVFFFCLFPFTDEKVCFFYYAI